jgi:hypothetical protein
VVAYLARPVPSVIAAVIATMERSAVARSIMVCP